jgi:hypothetical protein
MAGSIPGHPDQGCRHRRPDCADPCRTGGARLPPGQDDGEGHDRDGEARPHDPCAQGSGTGRPVCRRVGPVAGDVGWERVHGHAHQGVVVVEGPPAAHLHGIGEGEPVNRLESWRPSYAASLSLRLAQQSCS